MILHCPIQLTYFSPYFTWPLGSFWTSLDLLPWNGLLPWLHSPSNCYLSFSLPKSFLYLPQKRVLSLGSILIPHPLMASTTMYITWHLPNLYPEPRSAPWVLIYSVAYWISLTQSFNSCPKQNSPLHLCQFYITSFTVFCNSVFLHVFHLFLYRLHNLYAYTSSYTASNCIL